MENRIVKKIRLFLTLTVSGMCIMCCVGFAIASEKADYKEIFYHANLLYRENKYDDAVREYEKITAQGFESGNLYYNLANCYFKKEELGKAMVNYERAKLFIPNDGDLKSNYEYVASLLNVRTQRAYGNWAVRNCDMLFEGMGINFLTALLSLVYAVIFLFFAINTYRKIFRGFYKPLLCSVLFIGIAGGVSLKRRIDSFHKGAIAIKKEVQAKFEPLENATTYFTLPEGSKVEIVESSHGWYKVKRNDEKIGWADKNAFELIHSEAPTSAL